MRIWALIANLAQVGIVLAIFIRFGLNLGGWVIIGLFLLLIVALMNQIVVFFYAVNKAVHHPLINIGTNPIKRKDLRVTYASAPQPTVIINERPFNVLDLSENGVRFFIDREHTLQKRLKGRISLLCGQSISFQGTVIRRQNDEATIAFHQSVDQDIILKESRMLEAIT